MKRYTRSLFRWLLRPIVTIAVPAGILLLVFNTAIGPRVALSARHAMERLVARVTVVRPNGPVIVQQLQALNRLETARQTTQQVVEAKSSSPLFGDFLSKDQIVLLAQGEVVAGVDLSRLSPRDVSVHGDAVSVRLPQPEIFTVCLDDAHTRVAVRDRGLLVFNPDKDLERQARMEAQISTRQAAIGDGILNTARANAEADVRHLLQSLGFREVRFVDGAAA